MTEIIKKFSVILTSLMIFVCQATIVSADEYTVDVEGFYAHPITNIIEDSGGEANAALGQSMVSGVVDSTGLLETDLDGNLYLSFTFNLMDSISDVNIQVQSPGSDTWTDLAHETVVEGNDQTSFQVQMPSQTAILRGSLFVKPMGRSVVFFFAVGNATTGNLTDIPSIKQDYSSANAPATPSTSTSTSSSSGSSSSNSSLGDVDGLTLSLSQGSSTSTSASTSNTNTSVNATSSSGFSSVDVLLLIIAANLISGTFFILLIFVIRQIVRAEFANLQKSTKINQPTNQPTKAEKSYLKVVNPKENEDIAKESSTAKVDQNIYDNLSEEQWEYLIRNESKIK